MADEAPGPRRPRGRQKKRMPDELVQDLLQVAQEDKYRTFTSESWQSDAVNCVNKLHKRFREYFTFELAAEIVAPHELYFNVNAASAANSSPISYIQFTVDNDLIFPEIEVLTRLFVTLHAYWNFYNERSFSVLQNY